MLPQFAGQQCGSGLMTPVTAGAMTPANAKSATWRTVVCPFAPKKRSTGWTVPSASGLQTPANYWTRPGTGLHTPAFPGSGVATPLAMQASGATMDALAWALASAKLDMSIEESKDFNERKVIRRGGIQMRRRQTAPAIREGIPEEQQAALSTAAAEHSAESLLPLPSPLPTATLGFATPAGATSTWRSTKACPYAPRRVNQLAALGSGLQTPVNYWPSRPASGAASPGLVISGAATPLRCSRRFGCEDLPPPTPTAAPCMPGAAPPSADACKIVVTRRVRAFGRSRTVPVAPVMEEVHEDVSFQECPEGLGDSPSTSMGESPAPQDSSQSDLYLDSVDCTPEKEGNDRR